VGHEVALHGRELLGTAPGAHREREREQHQRDRRQRRPVARVRGRVRHRHGRGHDIDRPRTRLDPDGEARLDGLGRVEEHRERHARVYRRRVGGSEHHRAGLVLDAQLERHVDAAALAQKRLDA